MPSLLQTLGFVWFLSLKQVGYCGLSSKRSWHEITLCELLNPGRWCYDFPPSKFCKALGPILSKMKFWNSKDRPWKQGHTRIFMKFSYLLMHPTFYELSFQFQSFSFKELASKMSKFLIFKFFLKHGEYLLRVNHAVSFNTAGLPWKFLTEVKLTWQFLIVELNW